MCSGVLSSYVGTEALSAGPHVVSRNMVALWPLSLSQSLRGSPHLQPLCHFIAFSWLCIQSLLHHNFPLLHKIINMSKTLKILIITDLKEHKAPAL